MRNAMIAFILFFVILFSLTACDMRWYRDADEDGYGDPAKIVQANEQPKGYVSDNTDCNDANSAIYPGAKDYPDNGIDENCDATVEKIGKTIINSLGMQFNRIPAGTFMMGGPYSISPGNLQHQVTLTRDFYMQTTEVTQGQWEAVMGDNPAYFSACGADCPVESVSWNDVQTFIKELNRKGEGMYRLPAEAEWEYAARAGDTDEFANCDVPAGRRKFDEELDAVGWFSFNSAVEYPGFMVNRNGCLKLEASGWFGR